MLLRIVAQHADEWNLAQGTPEEFRHTCRVLDAHCRAVGRDPGQIGRSIQFLPEAMQGDIVGRARAFVGCGTKSRPGRPGRGARRFPPIGKHRVGAEPL